MKYLQRRLLFLLVCAALVVAGAVAATLRSSYRQQITGFKSPDSRPSSLYSTRSQLQQQGVAPQSIGPIDRSVIAGGGGTSTGGNFSESATVAEVSASNTLSGGSFTLNGGFWNTLGAPEATPTPTPSPTSTPTPTPTP